MSWLWIERLTWITILLVNLKRLCDYFAPYLFSWLLSFVIKKNLVLPENETLPDGDDLNFGSLTRAFEAGMKEFSKPAPPKKKSSVITDPNRRNVRARNNKPQ